MNVSSPQPTGACTNKQEWYDPESKATYRSSRRCSDLVYDSNLAFKGIVEKKQSTGVDHSMASELFPTESLTHQDDQQ